VRTIAVNGTMTARWPKSKLVTNEKIKVGDVIVGLAGFGQANYEASYNSGLASNGLTSARHDVLDKSYAARFPETFENTLDDDVVYIGPHKMTHEIDVKGQNLNIGKLLLSPTRTFAPIMKELLSTHFDSIHGLIHCSGGGQTKCLKYLPGNFRIVKDNLFEPPIIFQLIQKASGADNREMYQVFNMGTRLEIYTNEKDADKIISVSKSFGVDAQVIGRVEESNKKELLLKTASGTISW
jgi:phosphoribosylformylglycinamidine cyclo-ligase